jgi:hypothetical protein
MQSRPCELTCASWRSVVSRQWTVSNGKCEFVALDPSSLHVDVMIDAAIAAEQCGVGCVLYGTLSHLAATKAISVMTKARCELVFIDAIQEATLLARCFRSSQISAVALVASELASRLLGLPSDIRESFGGVSIPIRRGARSGSNRSNERRIERACKKVELATPSHFLTGVWIANSWRALRDGHEISEVALRDCQTITE